MTDETSRRPMSAEWIHAIALETGIRDDQIRCLMNLIGTDRSSLVREARILYRERLL
jgi:hypothetical protein